MRLTAGTFTAAAAVTADPAAHRRPVLLRFAGLVLAMTPAEARTLADQLHDAADQLHDTAEGAEQ